MIWFRVLQAVTSTSAAVFAAWVVYGTLSLFLTDGQILVATALSVLCVAVWLIWPDVVAEFRRIFPKDVL